MSAIQTITDSTTRFQIRIVLQNLLVALIGSYGLSVSALLILRALSGEQLTVVALFNSFLHLLILPALLLLPLSLLFRRRLLVVELAAPFLMALLAYAPLFWPQTTAAQPESPRLSLLSYNINTANHQIEPVIQIIRESNADVVAIQELSPWMAEAIDAQLAADYPYRALHPQADFSGQGVLSRYPIRSDDFWQINLGHQRVELDWNGQPLVLFNVHPVHPLRGLRYDGESRAEEVTDVLDRAGLETLPVVIAGDFNMTDFSADYARVAQLYSDSFREVGWGMGFTFPEFANVTGIALPPIARIDYIFYNADFQALEAQVIAQSGGSDHRPLFAVLALDGSL